MHLREAQRRESVRLTFYVHPSAKCLCVDETQPFVWFDAMICSDRSSQAGIIVHVLEEAAQMLKERV